MTGIELAGLSTDDISALSSLVTDNGMSEAAASRLRTHTPGEIRCMSGHCSPKPQPPR
jgi:hypothetical protein